MSPGKSFKGSGMSGTGFVLSHDVFLLEGKQKESRCAPERWREQELSSKGGKEEGVM